MKQIYDKNGYIGYDLMIEGYQCQLFETPEGRCSIRVPMGDNPEDKKMFDELVYHHKQVYHSDKQKQVIYQVADFIRKYKKQNEKVL